MATSPTIVVEPPIRVDPWPPTTVLTADELAELRPGYDERSAIELSDDFAPYTHIVRVTDATDDDWKGRHALAVSEEASSPG